MLYEVITQHSNSVHKTTMTHRIISQLFLLVAALVLYAQHGYAQDAVSEYVSYNFV